MKKYVKNYSQFLNENMGMDRGFERIVIEDESQMSQLSDGMTIDGDLIIRSPYIRIIPRVMVSGNLYIYGCKNLKFLPEGLKVGGDLHLEGCESLTSLPQDLEVGRDIYYNYKTGFAKIDGWKDNPGITPPHLKSKLI